jgi:S-(hydroxymethyl)glutathione dehydrogenase/alcohol dehydrogenase
MTTNPSQKKRRMRAAVMRGAKQPLAIEEVELAPPGRGEVLVRIAASGICHSDLNSLEDSTTPLPTILGHEGAGTVVEVGPGVSRLAPGEPVALSWLPYCGTCPACASGRVHLCDTAFGPMFAGTLLDGTSRLTSLAGEKIYHYSLLSTFAEYAVVDQRSCVALPPGVPPECGALLGCGVATGWGAAVRAGGVQPGMAVAVFGIGGVGVNAVQGARLAGAELVAACDLRAVNLESARSLGATHTLDASAVDVVSALKDLTGGQGVDVAIDASGSPRALEQAYRATRRGGTIVVVGAFPGDSTLTLPGGGFHRQGKVLRGSFYGDVDPLRDLRLLAELYVAGKLRLDELVMRRIPLEGIQEAMDAFHDPAAKSTGRWVVVF